MLSTNYDSASNLITTAAESIKARMDVIIKTLQNTHPLTEDQQLDITEAVVDALADIGDLNDARRALSNMIIAGDTNAEVNSSHG